MRRRVNQLPVGVEERLPARLIVAILQAAEQAAPRRQEIACVVGHGLRHRTLRI